MTEDQYLDAVAAGLLYQPQPMQKNTPATTNEIGEVVPRHEVFRQHDPVGGVMAVTAMGVVFLALVAIFLVFKVFGKIMIGQTNRTEAKHKGEPAPVATKDTSYSGEEVAAIAMALRLYSEDLHVTQRSTVDQPCQQNVFAVELQDSWHHVFTGKEKQIKRYERV